MEQQVQCPECHLWNSNDLILCSYCGARLHPFAGEWWKALNMSPVRATKIKYNYNSIASVIIIILGLEGYFFGSLFFCIVLYEHRWFIAGLDEDTTALLTILLGFILLIMFIVFARSNAKFKVFFNPDIIRKKSQELQDGDYVEVYKGWKWKRYIMVARGIGSFHKFGIFDTRKIKLCIPMIYDKLEWIGDDKKQMMLKGALNGYPVIIDVNGNNYQ